MKITSEAKISINLCIYSNANCNIRFLQNFWEEFSTRSSEMETVRIFVISAQHWGFADYWLQNNRVVATNSWFISFYVIIQSSQTVQHPHKKKAEDDNKRKGIGGVISLSADSSAFARRRASDKLKTIIRRAIVWTNERAGVTSSQLIDLSSSITSNAPPPICFCPLLSPSPSLAVSLQTPRQHSSLSTHLIKPFVKLRCEAERHRQH